MASCYFYLIEGNDRVILSVYDGQTFSWPKAAEHSLEVRGKIFGDKLVGKVLLVQSVSQYSHFFS